MSQATGATSPAEADPSRFLATSEPREAGFRTCAPQRGAYFPRTGTSPQPLQHRAPPPRPPPAARYLPRAPVEAGTTRLVQAIWDSGNESCRSNLSLHGSLNSPLLPPSNSPNLRFGLTLIRTILPLPGG